MITPTTVRTDVSAFAEAVRDALGDLPQDVVDDLTDGLEADLLERAEDAERIGEDLGDATGYAEELRAAAGLAAPGARRSRSRPRRESLAATLDRAATAARSTAVGAELVDALVALRPVWWVLRAWALYQLVVAVLGGWRFEILPFSDARWAAFAALLVVSVQWGRGRWLPRRRLRWLERVVSAVAAASLLVLVPLSIDAVSRSVESVVGIPPTPMGLTLDGVPVDNVFAYDADGDPLADVQLFDQDGRPLDLVGSGGPDMPWWYASDGSALLVPSGEVPGRPGWNVYPLSEADQDDLDTGANGDTSVDPRDVRRPSAPFARVQPLTSHRTTEEPGVADDAASDDGREAGSAAPSAPDASVSPSPSPIPGAPTGR